MAAAVEKRAFPVDLQDGPNPDGAPREARKRRRTKGPLTKAQLRRKEAVAVRRDKVRRINRKEADKFGAFRTMYTMDRVQRMKSENDELDENVEEMIAEVIRLRDSFNEKLRRREEDIKSGKVDPQEPEGKEKVRQIKQWLATVPTLLAQHERNKAKDHSQEFELTHLTTVFNYVHQGNNGGHEEDEQAAPEEETESEDITESEESGTDVEGQDNEVVEDSEGDFDDEGFSASEAEEEDELKSADEVDE